MDNDNKNENTTQTTVDKSTTSVDKIMKFDVANNTPVNGSTRQIAVGISTSSVDKIMKVNVANNTPGNGSTTQIAVGISTMSVDNIVKVDVANNTPGDGSVTHIAVAISTASLDIDKITDKLKMVHNKTLADNVGTTDITPAVTAALTSLDTNIKTTDESKTRHLEDNKSNEVMQRPTLKRASYYVDVYVTFVLSEDPHRHKEADDLETPKLSGNVESGATRNAGDTQLAYSASEQTTTPKTEKKVIRYKDEYSCWPPPIYMIIISALEITLFSIDASNGYIEAQGYVAAMFIYDPSKRIEVWRFFTYMFVHVGYVHILSNLLIQLMLGFPLELVHRWRIVLVYLAGVGAGSLMGSLVDSTENIAGASSGVYALSSAHIANLLLNWFEKRCASVQLLFFSVLVAVTLVLSPSAIINHGAGAVAGLLVGIGVLRNLKVRKWEIYLWWAAMTLYVLLMIGCVFAHIFWTSRFPIAESETHDNYIDLTIRLAE